MWETGRTIYGLASYFFTSHEQSFTEYGFENGNVHTGNPALPESSGNVIFIN